MRTTAMALLSGAILACAQPAFAQTADATPAEAAPTPAVAPATTCELHVWPGRSFHTVHYGWVNGGTIDGAQKGRKGYPPMPDQPLSVEVQRELLGKIDIPAMIGLSGFTAVVHENALSAAVIRSTPGRQIADRGPCYAELMIDDIVFQNHVINGKWLNIIFRFRQFEGAAAAPVRTYGTYVTVRTTLFPPDKDSDPQPALDELRSAYTQSLTEFGKQYAGFLKRNGKKKGASITL